MQVILKNGTFEEASIGIFAYDKNVIPYLNSKLNLESGVYVVEVIKNSPAEKAGIKKGDIIQKIDGNTLNKMSELRKYIYTKTSGDEVTLLVQRSGIVSPAKITLGKK